MTNIHYGAEGVTYQPHRQGMTVLPDDIDEATGNRIDGSSQVVDTRIANWNHEPAEDDPELIDEVIQDDIDHPDHIVSEVELATISTEINDSTVSYDETLATEIASLDFGNSPADITVQYLSHKVYAGELSPQEAFTEAVESGINPEALASSYQRLKAHFS